jgi:hypothetical protein
VRLLTVLAVLALDGCTPSSKVDARAEPAPTPSAQPTPLLSAPRAKAGSPIRVVGYPTPVRRCLPDPAQWAGFTNDGAFGYCANVHMVLECETIDAKGKPVFTESSASKGGAQPAFLSDPIAERRIHAWMKTVGMPAIEERDCNLYPPPATGTWAYGEVTLHVASVEGNQDAGTPPAVRLGGAIDGEAPVFPMKIDGPSRQMHDDAYALIDVNVLALSKDGAELGLVVHVTWGEYSDMLEVHRIRVDDLASRIYNDTGYAAYKRGDLTRAASLFARAHAADAKKSLPAYNLACANARLHDAGAAEEALAAAIAIDGDTIRARARTDHDFDGVRTDAWFKKLVDGR